MQDDRRYKFQLLAYTTIFLVRRREIHVIYVYPCINPLKITSRDTILFCFYTTLAYYKRSRYIKFKACLSYVLHLIGYANFNTREVTVGWSEFGYTSVINSTCQIFSHVRQTCDVKTNVYLQ